MQQNFTHLIQLLYQNLFTISPSFYSFSMFPTYSIQMTLSLHIGYMPSHSHRGALDSGRTQPYDAKV